MNTKPVQILICPYCERECGSASGLARHVNRCATKPPRETLAEFVDLGYTLTEMATELDLTVSAVADFLREEELSTTAAQRNGRRRKILENNELPALAPFNGNHCEKCPRWDLCEANILYGDNLVNWWPCEIPTVDDARISNRRWPRF